jgi:hypothetical protein
VEIKKKEKKGKPNFKKSYIPNMDLFIVESEVNLPCF